MKAEHQAERDRLVEYLTSCCVGGFGGVPHSHHRPDKAYIALISREANVPSWTISDSDGRHRTVLLRFVRDYGLKPHTGFEGGAFARSDAAHAKLLDYLHRQVANGRGIPSIGGRPNMAAVARAVGMHDTTLTMPGHRNREAVLTAYRAAGPGPERARGPITVDQMLAWLGGANA